MAVKEITTLVRNLRLHRGDELESGDIVQSVSRHFSFRLGLVVHRSESDGRPVIAPLDGEHRLNFWPHEKDLCFLRIVASNDLAVRFDSATLGDQSSSPYKPGALTVAVDGVFLCLQSSRNFMQGPQLLSLSSWQFVQPRFEDGRFAVYKSGLLGRLSEDGVFVFAASVSEKGREESD